jgi:hypothetical protein
VPAEGLLTIVPVPPLPPVFGAAIVKPVKLVFKPVAAIKIVPETIKDDKRMLIGR